MIALTKKSKISLAIILSGIALLTTFFFVNKSTKPIERKIAPLQDISFEIPVLPEITFPKEECKITDYGAIGDGIFSNTEAIKKAIADCEKNGGGKVVVPNGKWFTGPIVLKSNINLFLEKDAEIIFSQKFSDYLPVVFSRFEGLEFYNYSPLIYALDAENIAITGQGTINGNGEAWWDWKNRQDPAVLNLYSLANAGVVTNKRIFGTESDALRPSFVQFVRSKNIVLENVSFINSPMWAVHPLYSENILIRGIRVDSDGPNTDGIVIDSSKNIIIENTFVNSGDDAIVIKSGKDKDGLLVNKISENIIVRNSTIKNGHSGFAIGSEMSGGVRNVFFVDSSIDRVDFGLQIKSMQGRGGVIENIWFRNITIRRASEQAILVNMQYGTPIDPTLTTPPVFRNIYFQNINCRRTGDAIIVKGLPDNPVRDIHFSNITISAKTDTQQENVENSILENVEITILPKEMKK